jgi:ElaB/YqjD/DUF883 family membrane-anchored ribosome-binding protein
MSEDRAVKLDQLIDDAEELLTKLADAHDPHIQALRDRVDKAITNARRDIARSTADGSAQIRDIANAVDDYIRDYPWLAVATGMLVAGSVAFIAGATLVGKKGSPRDWL